MSHQSCGVVAVVGVGVPSSIPFIENGKEQFEKSRKIIII